MFLYSWDVLLYIALAVSSLSYLYDFTHEFRRVWYRELTEYTKFIVYGVALFFITLYVSEVFTSKLVEDPLKAYIIALAVATLASGNSVKIVNLCSKVCHKIIEIIVEKFSSALDMIINKRLR